MKIFESIGTGTKKVLIGHPIYVTPRLIEVVSSCDVKLFFVASNFYARFYGVLPKIWTRIGKVAPAYYLDKALEISEYKEIMDTLVKEIKDNGISHVLLNSNMWHPQYLEQLRKSGVILATKIVDDPEGSIQYSKPIVRFYDKCICSGVYYDKNRTIADMYRRWGAKDVSFLPVFVNPYHYDTEEIDYAKKDIDIIHVGSFNWKRWIFLHRLYRRFGSKLKLYSRYDPRQMKNIFGIVYRLLNVIFPLPTVADISDEELKDVYKRSKIGFNRHLSYGPSNARSYELCLNGVLQVTDNPKGYNKLYNVGKEIVCYDSIGDAMEKIEYFLRNNTDREEVAHAGYVKAHREYRYEKIMENHLRYVLS